MKTYSLAEVAAIALPPELKHPERWLRERLNRRVIRGYRVGRIWRMTQTQLDWLVEYLSNTVPAPAAGGDQVEAAGPGLILAGMSDIARARIQRAQARPA